MIYVSQPPLPCLISEAFLPAPTALSSDFSLGNHPSLFSAHEGHLRQVPPPRRGTQTKSGQSEPKERAEGWAHGPGQDNEHQLELLLGLLGKGLFSVWVAKQEGRNSWENPA